MLIILTLTFIQGHTDINQENNKCQIISETVQAMRLMPIVCCEDSLNKGRWGRVKESVSFSVPPSQLLFVPDPLHVYRTHPNLCACSRSNIYPSQKSRPHSWWYGNTAHRKQIWAAPYHGSSLSHEKATQIFCAFHWDKNLI